MYKTDHVASWKHRRKILEDWYKSQGLDTSLCVQITTKTGIVEIPYIFLQHYWPGYFQNTQSQHRKWVRDIIKLAQENGGWKLVTNNKSHMTEQYFKQN